MLSHSFNHEYYCYYCYYYFLIRKQLWNDADVVSTVRSESINHPVKWLCFDRCTSMCQKHTNLLLNYCR